jgi:hypothetical protein
MLKMACGSMFDKILEVFFVNLFVEIGLIFCFRSEIFAMSSDARMHSYSSFEIPCSSIAVETRNADTVYLILRCSTTNKSNCLNK